MTSAARLQHRIALEAPTTAPNGGGGTVSGWASQWECAAHIRFLRGSDSVIAARLAGNQPVVVTIRNCTAARACKVDWRVRDLRSGAVYEVKTLPVVSEDRQFLEITAQGVQP